MRGCAGAGSTHPGLDLYGFRVLSNSDRVPVLLLVLCTCLACWKLAGLVRTGGASLGLRVARGL